MKKPHILFVEDDAWLAEHFERIAIGAGWTAETTPHALAAMEAIDQHIPNVLVLDVLLVGPNAFTLLHELRSHADLAAIPVVLCTNSAGDIAPEDLAVYGVREVLDKATMRPEDLLAAVKRIIT